MSVLVKGVDIPKDCVYCKWHTRWGCEITGIVTNTAQGCPLIEVPTPHGPLIDKGRLPHYTGYALSASEVAKAVEAAPTIIEAEEGTDHE